MSMLFQKSYGTAIRQSKIETKEIKITACLSTRDFGQQTSKLMQSTEVFLEHSTNTYAPEDLLKLHGMCEVVGKANDTSVLHYENNKKRQVLVVH